MRPEEFDIVAALQQGLTTQTYNDILAKIITHDHHMREGETITADVTMVRDQEELFIVQKQTKEWTRNPLVFQGEYINVHQGKDGNHYATLRKLVLIDGFNAVRIGNAITTELKNAKKMLGL
jgi:hypothetical protein